MTIGTWNVNGIRARQSQVQEWVRRERPDIVCLQEIKAGSDQVPTALCEMEDYWCYWHGAKGYSGVGLHVSKAFAPSGRCSPIRPSTTRAASSPSRLRGVTVASVYVPNGGKDFDAEDAVPRGDRRIRAAGARGRASGSSSAATSTSRRADIDVHPKERKPRAIGQLPEERAMLERLLGARAGGHRPGARPGERPDVHVVGAVAEHASAQHRLAARLRPGEPGGFRSRSRCTVHRDFGTSDHAPVVARFDV